MKHRAWSSALGLCAVICSLGQPAAAAPMKHAWSRSLGDTGFERAQDVTTDASGNVIVVGYFNGTVDFGGGPLVSAGGADIFVAKYDGATGNHIWSQRFGGVDSNAAYAITTESNGNIIVLGEFFGLADFGGGPRLSVGFNDILLLKLNPSGGYIWDKTFGDNAHDYALAVATDNANNIVISGNFEGTVNFGGGALTNAGLRDIYLAKFQPDGTHLWSQSFGGINADYGYGVSTDSSDNVILTGTFWDTADFGGGALVSAGFVDAFIAKFDGAGSHLWSQNFGDAGYDEGRDITVDASDNVITIGEYTGSIDFGGGALSGGSSYNIYLAKLDAGGNHIWSQSFGGALSQFGVAVAVGSDGDIAISGYFAGDVDFGGGTLNAAGPADAHVARFDAAGAHMWSRKPGVSGSTVAYGVAMDPSGNVVLAGYYDDATDLGGGLLVSAGSSDAFVAKYWAPPVIHSVLDVAGDQGGVVNLAWYRSGADNPDEQAITEYTLWRALPTPAYKAMVESGATVSTAPPVHPELRTDAPYIRIQEAANATYFWYLVSTVQAFFLGGYSAPIPTLNDSTSVDPGTHFFQVIAHTSDPGVFLVSDPDTGYSVDNLPPAMVINLVGEQATGPGGLTMTWDPNTEADLDHYVVYRGTTPDFTPGPGNLIGSPTLPTLEDGTWTWDSGYYYKVAAVDEHENEGEAALLGPGFVVGVAPANLPNRNYLGQNVPNPFNPSTTITFGLKEPAEVTLRIYDASGQLVRTLVDGLRPAGPNEATWHGKDEDGRPVASGVYFYRMEVGGESFARKLVLLK